MIPLPLILYDGVCGLCQRSVRFILRWEQGPDFRFLPLQSELAGDLLRRHGISPDTDAIVLLEEEGVWVGAEAALRICRRLRAPVRWLGVFRLLPPALRNRLYRAVASRRLRWFGESPACELPDPSQAERFLG